MKKLLAGALALSISFSASADWVINQNGVPYVGEKNSSAKLMALLEVCDEMLPTVFVADINIPDDAIGAEVAFQARIDRHKVHTVTTKFVQMTTELKGVLIDVDQVAFEQMKRGENFRVRFRNTDGSYVVETYSLKGITKTYNDAGALCDADFFEETPIEENENYF